MTAHRLSVVVILMAVLAASCAALLVARSVLQGDRMVDSRVVQLEVALQEHREVTHLLQRMH